MSELHKPNRRDFLRGKAAVDALADLADSAKVLGDTATTSGEEAALSLSEAEDTGYLTTFTRRAMACEFAVFLNAGQYPQGTEAALESLDLVEQLESQLTVFRDTSEIVRINQTAQTAEVEVEPRLFELLVRAKKIYDATEGAYDIATGKITKLWGFYRRQGNMPDTQGLDAVLQHGGMRNVKLDENRRTVRFLAPDVEFNLGSIGKGYALDRMAELLRERGIRDYLLHGGNSSVLARGRKGFGRELSKPSPHAWWIGLRHPLEPQRRIGELQLCDRALGTSGSNTQFFIHEGHRYGHILDPRSGWPAEGMLSTTVAAGTAAEADALATALYVLGPKKAIEYCRANPNLSAVLMWPAEESGRVEIALWGLSSEQVRMDMNDASLSITFMREANRPALPIFEIAGKNVLDLPKKPGI
ncbi:MAG TPA: FAD:protein FMN transferase [Pirellulales bacterium]|jgi:thiamine biosynthesis lipoprotein|nr:FAD:protein FMN transferase [Pirellulales bacterium]